MKDSKKHNCYLDLKQQVLTLTLSPGSALDEVALSAEYGLSRTPLREVIQRLAGEGYLSLASNRGAFVSSMDLNTMRSFFQSAPMIYAAIARLACEQATKDQINAVKKTQMRFKKAMKLANASEMVVNNHRLHEEIGEMAASPYLSPSLGRLLIDHARMSQRFYRVREAESKQRILKASEQHDAMIDAIEQRNPSQCVDLTLEHWELSRRDLNKYVMPDPLPVDAAVELVG